MDLMMGLPLDWKCFNGSSHPNSLWPFLMLMYLVINVIVSPYEKARTRTVQDFQFSLPKSDLVLKRTVQKLCMSITSDSYKREFLVYTCRSFKACLCIIILHLANFHCNVDLRAFNHF